MERSPSRGESLSVCIPGQCSVGIPDPQNPGTIPRIQGGNQLFFVAGGGGLRPWPKGGGFGEEPPEQVSPQKI